MDKIR